MTHNTLYTMAYRHVAKHGTKEECAIVMQCQEFDDKETLFDILVDIREQRLSEVN